MKTKKIIELNENLDIVIVDDEIFYDSFPDFYMPRGKQKNEIFNVTEDNMEDVINHIVTNNKYTFFVNFLFKEKERKLEIFSDKILKNVDIDLVLQKHKSNQYKSISKLLNSAITLIDYEFNTNFNEYATVYDILQIHKSLSCFDDKVHYIEKEYTKKLSLRGKNNCVKIDSSRYLEGKENYIKLTIGEHPFYVTKDFVRINSIGYGNEAFSTAKITLSKEWKHLFNILDIGRDFFNYEGKDNVEILNYNGTLHIDKEGIILTNNETFTIRCKHKEELEPVSSYYREFSLLKETSEELLKRSFIKISDCPQYLQKTLKILNNIKTQEKAKKKTYK